MRAHPEKEKPELYEWLKCGICGYCEKDEYVVERINQDSQKSSVRAPTAKIGVKK